MKIKINAYLSSAIIILSSFVNVFVFFFASGAIANTADITGETVSNLEKSEAASSLGAIYYLMAGITIFALILAAIACFVAIKFYLWRRTIDNSGAMYPEEWGAYLERVSNEVQRQAAELGELRNINTKLAGFVQSVGQENVREVKSIKEIMLEFRKNLDAKDDEILRLRKGYDYVIMKKILTQLAILHEKCKELLSTDQDNKSLKNFEILLKDNLVSSGVEFLSPDLGTDYSKLADYVEVVGYTPISNRNFRTGDISEVVSPAYIYRAGGAVSVLRKAKIKYWALEENK
tara:strand:- start:884 stop:1753 length:870 start_codon:yes stop_codon:yes gene_type:complete